MLPLELAGQAEPCNAPGTISSGLDWVHAWITTRPCCPGEQQRVAIARAFAASPAILFADEPTGNLDTNTGNKIIELLFELNQSEGTTLVLVTHDERLAARCRRRFLMDSGTLEERPGGSTQFNESLVLLLRTGEGANWVCVSTSAGSFRGCRHQCLCQQSAVGPGQRKQTIFGC